ncbi:MAG TPA: phosphoribosyltransferase family protein [Methylomirabilota bacterium]|jgi:hypoxanthine phosphoribosyltransferase|nr:phosphoribosyltransferase family protein [Methylomirabilota bacterium]
MSGRKPASSTRGRQAIKANANGRGVTFSEARIAGRVAELGKEISRAYQGRRLDIVVTMDRGFMFAADLIRELDGTVVCHFVREDLRDVEDGGRPRREVLFGAAPDLKGRDVLLVDAVLESGVTQEFLLRRLGESSPRSLRLAVLLDKPEKRRVDLESDYFGFKTASKEVWVGYGLAAANGTGRNLRQLSNGTKSAEKAERRKR